MAFARDAECRIHVAICFYGKLPFVKCKEVRRVSKESGWEAVSGLDETNEDLATLN
ncbi:MAG TPA: hypothetical protein VMF89_35410 [Polyangiales bacterium]|nr:hypothetical protein [Polyangiales bacterium]